MQEHSLYKHPIFAARKAMLEHEMKSIGRVGVDYLYYRSFDMPGVCLVRVVIGWSKVRQAAHWKGGDSHE